jgi:hypothetical protein
MHTDTDHTGYLDYKEMRKLVEACFRNFKPEARLTEKDFALIEKLLDADEDGRVEASELHAGMREWFPEVTSYISYVYICVCIYAYMYVYIYVYIYVCIYTYAYMHMSMHTYVHTRIYAYVCMHACKHQTYVIMYVFMYASYVCIYFMYVCMYLCMYVLCIGAEDRRIHT